MTATYNHALLGGGAFLFCINIYAHFEFNSDTDCYVLQACATV
jgi:hypothetical protein